MRAAPRLGSRFPPDGRGLFAGRDSELAAAVRAASDSFWVGRVPRWARWAAVAVSRCAWGILAPLMARHYGRVRKLTSRDTWWLTRDCVRSGGQPNEVWIWSQCFPAGGIHPLPARAASALFSWLGDRECQKVLFDKVAAARMLEAAGLRTPRVVRVMARGSIPAIDGEFFGSEPSSHFIKPRHGSASRGTLLVDVLGKGSFSLNGSEAIGVERLAARLAADTAEDDLLLQERLTACPEMADLSAQGRAPVFRVTTAREPGGAPFVHSALLSIPVPRQNPVDFLKGHVWTPADPGTGVLGYGIRFAEPGNRMGALPWNGAPLRGRTAPWFAESIEAALAAMRLVPGLPLVAWDAIITSEGPSILEGNTSGSWILTRLPSLQGMETTPLEPLLVRWARARALSMS